MAILPIIVAPDPILKKKSDPVAEVDDSVRALLNDLADTMYYSQGIGLAAVQVGVHKRVIVVDVNWREDEDASRKPMKLVNPEIIWDSEEQNIYKEGCLSFPEQYSDVERPKEIKVKYLDENGAPQEIHATGLLATCIQHEIDHTNGITFVDHISAAKKDMIIRKLTKLKREGYFDPHVHDEHCNH
jgi:peptide deformylase